MTPEERALVAELFDRLAKLENAPREPEADAAINDGLRRAPHAVYALVQTILVQNEALKRADAHIRELEAALGPEAAPPPSGGFLDNVRGALFGRGDQPRGGSVPSVPPMRPGDTPWGAAGGGGGGYPPGGGGGGGFPPGGGGGGGFPPGGGGGGGYPPPGAGAGYAPMGGEPMRPGGSFLGTMATSAAGMIGGSLLLDGMRSLMGHRPAGASPFGNPGGDSGRAVASPWSGSDASGSGLARDAGLGDIGQSRTAQASTSSDQRAGLFDSAGGNDADDQTDFVDDADSDFDGGDFDGGGGDGGDGN